MKPAKETVELALLVVLACPYLTDARADETAVLVTADKIYTMSEGLLQPGAVLISDGKIAQVANTLEAAEGTKVIKHPGVIIPGLIDANRQMANAGGLSEFTREVTPAFRVLSGIDWGSRTFREAVDEGVTCVNLTPGTENVFAGLSCVVKTAGNPKRRIVQKESALLISVCSDPRQRNRARTRPDSIFVRQPTNRMGVIWILRHTLHNPASLSGDHRRAITRALSGAGKIHAVARTDFDIQGVLNLSEEFKFAPTILSGEDAYKVAELLASAKVPVVLSPLTTLISGAGAEGTDRFLNRAGHLHDSGVSVALSGGQLLEQVRFAVRFGLDPDTALRCVTTAPAEILGLQDRLGSIAHGKDADLVALDGDPLDFTTSVDWVMVGGTVHLEGK